MHQGYPHYPLVAYGYTPQSITYDEQLRAISTQLDAARRGKFAKTYLEAGPHYSSMLNAPSQTRAAHLRVAYWLAVAARMGYTKLIPVANAGFKVAFDMAGNDEVGSKAAKAAIIKRGIEALNSVGANKDGRMAEVYRRLNQLSDTKAMAETEEYQRQQSTWEQTKDAAKQTGKDILNPIVSPFELIASFFSGKIPDNWKDRKGTWWAMRIAFFGIPGYVLYSNYVRPIIGPIFKKRPASESEQSSESSRRPSLTELASEGLREYRARRAASSLTRNPRRRRSRR